MCLATLLICCGRGRGIRWLFFFFQAEDGIRDHCVTGVQTCALPISSGCSAVSDSRSIRTSAVQRRVTYYTTVAGARAACEGMRHMKSLVPYPLQELHEIGRASCRERG